MGAKAPVGDELQEFHELSFFFGREEVGCIDVGFGAGDLVEGERRKVAAVAATAAAGAAAGAAGAAAGAAGGGRGGGRGNVQCLKGAEFEVVGHA